MYILKTGKYSTMILPHIIFEAANKKDITYIKKENLNIFPEEIFIWRAVQMPYLLRFMVRVHIMCTMVPLEAQAHLVNDTQWPTEEQG